MGSNQVDAGILVKNQTLLHVPHPASTAQPLLPPLLSPFLRPSRPFVRTPSSRRSDAMNFFKTKQRTPTDLVRGLRDNILKLESAPPGEPRKKVRHLLPWLCVRHLHRRRCGPLPRPVKTSASTCNRSRACSMAMEVRRSMFMFLSLLSPPPTPSSLSMDSD